MTEADTCRKYVVPQLQSAGWDDEPHSIAEQRTITDGRVIPVGKGFVRKPPKRVDYLLRYTRDFPLAVVEAKPSYKSATDAVQQARDYAEILGLKFAYATNGADIIEIDYFKGTETHVAGFPAPDALWERYQKGSGIDTRERADHLIAPYNTVGGKPPRYYQQIAINRTVEAILSGKKRLLLTMATGTGKTIVAFQICWKLWSSRWNAKGEYRKPRILFLADRNILIDDPKDKTFTPFGDARHKIESGEIVQSREMYFAIYQALAEDERRAGLFRDYPSDFFDLIIVDECHRGSAREDSSWRVILEHFKPAYQLGMTAIRAAKSIDDARERRLGVAFGQGLRDNQRPQRLLDLHQALRLLGRDRAGRHRIVEPALRGGLGGKVRRRLRRLRGLLGDLLAQEFTRPGLDIDAVLHGLGQGLAADLGLLGGNGSFQPGIGQAKRRPRIDLDDARLVDVRLRRLGARLGAGPRDVGFGNGDRNGLAGEFKPPPLFGNGRLLGRGLGLQGLDFEFVEAAGLLGRVEPGADRARDRIVRRLDLLEVCDLLPNQRVVERRAKLRLPRPHAGLDSPVGIVLNTIGRIGHHQVRARTIEQLLDRRASRIPAARPGTPPDARSRCRAPCGA